MSCSSMLWAPHCGFAWLGREHVPRNCAPWMPVEEVEEVDDAGSGQAKTRSVCHLPSAAKLRHTLHEEVHVPLNCGSEEHVGRLDGH